MHTWDIYPGVLKQIEVIPGFLQVVWVVRMHKPSLHINIPEGSIRDMLW